MHRRAFLRVAGVATVAAVAGGVPAVVGSLHADVPPCGFTGPSLVTVSGRQVIVQKRRPDNSLGSAQPYRIKGVNWAPASQGSGPADRQAQYAIWQAIDIPLMHEMHANTVRVFLDFGTDQTALGVLDDLQRQGIMAIVTVDKMVNDTENITTVVNAYKNHPAVLMWSLGNEWNINLYFGKFGSVDDAAQATEQAAVQIKGLDPNHPVISSFGDIDIRHLTPLSKSAAIINTQVPSADVWGLNIFRGTTFGTLFDQWASISTKPMFLGEFGTDAFNQNTGQEDQVLQANLDGNLWDEIADRLSADDPMRPALGGCVFEWNDEWWKAGNPSSHDGGGFVSGGHPDGFSNEEWYGVVDIARNKRQAFYALQTRFGTPVPPALLLSLNQAAFVPGDVLTLTMTTQSGVPANVNMADFYLAALVPGGAAYLFDGTAWALVFDGVHVLPAALKPFRGNGTVSNACEAIFSGMIPAIPPGTYTFVAILVSVGADPVNTSNWLSAPGQAAFTV